MQNKKQLDTSYTDEDLFVLMSYKEENEAETETQSEQKDSE